jgi:hypothetical protein
MQSKNGIHVWQELRRSGLRYAIEDAEAALAGCVLVATLLASCGGNFDNRPRIESQGEERDSGASGPCVEQPWAMAFGFSIDASGVISNASMDFLPANHARLTQTVSNVAQGAPGSEGLLAASLISGGGDLLSRALFEDPRLAGAYGRSERGGSYGELFIQLVPEAIRLVITNWSTGAVLLDLDFRGDAQLLCLNHPCLTLCGNPDGGVSRSPDGSADLPEAVDLGGTQ